MSGCTITAPHCELCGSTDPEDVPRGGGYSACCNELVKTSDTCRDHHGDDEESGR